MVRFGTGHAPLLVFRLNQLLQLGDGGYQLLIRPSFNLLDSLLQEVSDKVDITRPHSGLIQVEDSGSQK